jgi:hypothetical protein
LPRSIASNGEGCKKKALKNQISSESCSHRHAATFLLHEARFGGVHAWGDDVSIQDQIIRFGESASLFLFFTFFNL